MRRFLPTLSLVGLFCLGFSLTLLLPMLVALIYDEARELLGFVEIAVVIGLAGALLWLPGRNRVRDLQGRDGFLIVALFWFVLSLLGALPFMRLAGLSFVDALFEAASGFTTTGSTVMHGLDALPRSFLFYRQYIQWLGGMGLIVLAVAVMPMLGIGGMGLYRAEAPGPMKEEKLAPRLAGTARILWSVYLGITLLCAIGYLFAGMDLFDAVAHSLSTVSTGGFSPHDESLAWFHNPRVELVAIVFMMLGAINFSVHYQALHHADPRIYLRNVEVRVFLVLIAVVSLLMAVMLHMSGEYAEIGQSARYAVFEVVSVITSTGLGTVDFSQWPDFLPVLLIFISFIGGCGGSTAGGMKVMRVILISLQGVREVRRLIHPRGIFPVRLEGRVIPDRTVESVWGFLAIYVFAFIVLMLLMMHTGMDQVSAFSAIATCMNNLGPGLGAVSLSFADVSDAGKLVSVFAMILGRLEIFTVLVLLTPAYWRV
ncbi:MAG: potassium transporter [Gammaproteobacteria bacterium]|nr:MAG: potassium transporter [Gammaproteobacteria bacterium]